MNWRLQNKNFAVGLTILRNQRKQSLQKLEVIAIDVRTPQRLRTIREARLEIQLRVLAFLVLLGHLTLRPHESLLALGADDVLSATSPLLNAGRTTPAVLLLVRIVAGACKLGLHFRFLPVGGFY